MNLSPLRTKRILVALFCMGAGLFFSLSSVFGHTVNSQEMVAMYAFGNVFIVVGLRVATARILCAGNRLSVHGVVRNQRVDQADVRSILLLGPPRSRRVRLVLRSGKEQWLPLVLMTSNEEMTALASALADWSGCKVQTERTLLPT